MSRININNSNNRNIKEIYDLAKALSNQSWDTIGSPSINGLTNSSKSKEELEHQLTSLLTVRLDILAASREHEHKAYSISRVLSDLNNGTVMQSSTLVINPEIYNELKMYVSCINKLYNDIPYHSFYHAAQVTISMNKLISMLIEEEQDNLLSSTTVTHGIGNDALTQFALLFSALIHDAGHTGISNMQLSKERNELSLVYNDQSIAEQYSISQSFMLLYSDRFTNLLNFIAPTIEIKRKFRRLVIEIVMCTDIASPDRTQLAKSKWKEAFETQRNYGTRGRFGIRRSLNLSGDSIEFYTDSEIDIKSSTCLEQMMAVADISHLYQDYDTLLIWNEKLFHELIVAHSQQRGFDPCGFWFKGQIGFIDNYVIPLADRLSLCNVFGDNSFLFLKNAKEIRRRWIIGGYQFCEELLDKYSDLLEDDYA